MVKSKRSRTPSKYIYYALYLYFSGLSLRKKRQNIYCHLLKGIMFQYGIGFNVTSQQSYGRREEKYQDSL
jgi:hypothetical protein